VFLAPGMDAPRRYWEIEVSPLGVLFAARIENPTGLRADLKADTSWECRDLEWRAAPAGASQDWWAALAIPWPALAGGDGEPGKPPRRWRANFYRIERPRGGPPELSCWSPTMTDPPDFHRPERFGVLELGPGGRRGRALDEVATESRSLGLTPPPARGRSRSGRRRRGST
jgi:hypothetical protein